MTAVDTSELAVRTLADVDPDFRALLDALYGPGASVDEVYTDVYKFDPGPSDLGSTSSISAGKQKSDRSFDRQRKIAIAGVLAGTALGAKEMGQAFHGPHLSAIRNGMAAAKPLTRRGVLTGAGVGTVAIGADVNEYNVLRNKKKLAAQNGDAPMLPKAASLEPVGKLVSISDMKNGLHAARHKLTPNAFKSGSGKVFVRQPPKANMTSKVPPAKKNQAQANGAAAQQLVGSFVGTKTGKGLIAVGAGKLGYDRIKAHSDRKNEMESQYLGYGKADTSVEWAGTFSKLDEDKQLAFGWASVVKLNGVPIVDKQDDYITPEDLETAVYSYMITSRKGGHMHQRDAADLPVHVSDIVESIVFTDEKIAKMGLPDSMPRGWWIGTKIHDPEVWQEVKKGNLAGFSIHGKGRRTPIDEDELMGWT